MVNNTEQKPKNLSWINSHVRARWRGTFWSFTLSTNIDWDPRGSGRVLDAGDSALPDGVLSSHWTAQPWGGMWILPFRKPFSNTMVKHQVSFPPQSLKGSSTYESIVIAANPKSQFPATRLRRDVGTLSPRLTLTCVFMHLQCPSN